MGVIVETKDNEVTIIVSQSRWDNTRACIFWVAENIRYLKGLDRELLEKNRGFLIYVEMNDTTLVPYLKEIPLTLNSWRDNRNKDGLRMEDGRWNLKRKIGRKTR